MLKDKVLLAWSNTSGNGKETLGVYGKNRVAASADASISCRKSRSSYTSTVSTVGIRCCKTFTLIVGTYKSFGVVVDNFFKGVLDVVDS